MGFLDDLGAIFGEIGKMNDDAMRESINLSNEDLCYKINNTNVLVNPLIWNNCHNELQRRVKMMTNSEIKEYYEAYKDCLQQDAAEVFANELRSREYEIE